MRYIAYTDGSYKEVPGIGAYYSAAAIIAPEGTEDWSVLTQVGSDSLTALRNVAGELMAVMLLCEYCLKLPDCTELVLYHDYEGVSGLLFDGTLVRNDFTKAYKRYMRHNILPRIQVTFKRIDRDAKIAGNVLVDRYAKEAIEQQIKQRTEESHGRNI